MQKKYQNKLPCIKAISKLSRKRRSYALLAIKTICGERANAKIALVK